MATQTDRQMTNWQDYFQSKLRPPQLPQKPPFAQNSAINSAGYDTGFGIASYLLGERYPKVPNAGINTDSSQAQSDAHMQNLINSTVDPNSALGQAMQQYGTGFEPKQTWAQQHDINQIANSMGNTAWNNAVAQDTANNQYSFNPTQYLLNKYPGIWRR